MLKKNFEAIVAVQDRHIARLERMVEQLFNARISQDKPEAMIDLAENPDVSREPDAAFPMPGSMINDM